MKKQTYITMILMLVLIVATQTVNASSTVAYDGTRQNGQTGTNFNGSQFISTPITLNQTTGWTVIVFGTQTVNTTLGRIFRYDTSGTDISGYISFGPTNTDYGLRMVCSSCSDTILSGSSTLPTLGKQYMMVFQYNGTHMITYRDGSLELTDDTDFTSGQTTGTFNLGGQSGSTYQSGNNTKVLIYNRTLSASEIVSENTTGANALTTNTNSLVLEWYLNDTGTKYANSTTAIDLSYPNVFVNNPTPANNTFISGTEFTISVNVTTFNVTTLVVRINNNDYEIRDSALLWLEFDNNSVLGENSTLIKDSSQYNRVVNITGATVQNSGVYFNGLDTYLTVDQLNIYSYSKYGFLIDFDFYNKTLASGGVNGALFNQRSGGPANGGTIVIYLNKTTNDGSIIRNPGFVLRHAVYNATFSEIINNGYGRIYDGQRYYYGTDFNTTNYGSFLYGGVDSIVSQTKVPTATSGFEIGTYRKGTSGNSMNGTIYQFIVFNRSLLLDEIKNKYSFTKTSSNTYLLNITRLLQGNRQYNISIIVNGIETPITTVVGNTSISVNATLNLATPSKVINFSYGIQDSFQSRYVLSPVNTSYASYYKNMSIDYYRTWISNPDTVSPATANRLDMMPVGKSGSCLTYDYTNLTIMWRWTLLNNMTPHNMFVHIPYCWANYTASGSVMPMMNITYSTDLWANYTRDIVYYAYQLCSNGTLTCTGTQAFSNWIWQIGNEPGGNGEEGNFSTYVVRVYQPSINRIRELGLPTRILTGTVQSYGHMTSLLTLINSSQQPDIVSIHYYDNLDITDPDMPGYTGISFSNAIRTSTQGLYYDAYNGYKNFIYGYNPNISVYNDEYSLDSEYSPHKVRFINDTAGSSWMASSLYWQLQTNSLGENQYEGLGNDQYGYGILVTKNSTSLSSARPLVSIREIFGNFFNTGKNLYVGSTTDNMIEIASTDEKVVINNKYNETVNLSLIFSTSKIVTNSSNSVLTPQGSTYNIMLSGNQVETLTISNGTLYVNTTSGSCSAAYTRAQASNPSTPWCDISTAETNAQDGDTVIVADGVYRNTNGYNFNVKYNSTVTYYLQSNNTIITRAQSNAESVPNTVWTNVSNSTNTNMWSYSYVTGSSTVSAEYVNTSQPILRCSANNLSIAYADRGFECTYFTSNTLYLDLAPGKNPRNIPLYVFNGDVLVFDNAWNVKFNGGTVRGGWQLVDSSASGQSINITLENMNFLGGTSDTGALDFRRTIGLTLINNTLFRTQLTSWWWTMIKQANLGGETAAVYCANGCNNTLIMNNTITGYFNGIVLVNTTAGSVNGITNFHNILLQNNFITDIYDDAIEFEGIGNNITIFNNTINNTFVAISLTSFNNTIKPMNINYNIISSVRRINATKSGSTFGTYQGESFKLLANYSLINAIIDHNSMYGDRNIACRADSTEVYTNCMQNVNITNNVMMSENNYVLDGSGLNSSGVYYNYNLYFNATGGSNIFRYWNSLTDNQYSTLASALASANNPGTWDNGSYSQSPLIENFLTGNFTPAGNSVLCNASSDGTTIGAVECSEYTYNAVNVTITSANNTTIYGVQNFQVNFTITGTQPTYCDFYIDGLYYNNITTSSAGDYNTTGLISAGSHDYYLTCYDELFATADSQVYTITLEKVLINATIPITIGSETGCLQGISNGCTTGNAGNAYDGNFSSKAILGSGSTQYINYISQNYSKPADIISADLYYKYECSGTSTTTKYTLTTAQLSQTKQVLLFQSFKPSTTWYIIATIYNGTTNEYLGTGAFNSICQGTTPSIYETLINYTTNKAINFTSNSIANNSIQLQSMAFTIANTIIDATGSYTHTLLVYNTSGNLVYSNSIDSTQTVAFNVTLNAEGTYYYNITSENATHYALSTTRTVIIGSLTQNGINTPIDGQQIYTPTFNVSWNASTSSQSVSNISHYNATLNNLDRSTNQTLNTNLNTTTSFIWNTTASNLSTATYYMRIYTYDTLGAYLEQENMFHYLKPTLSGSSNTLATDNVLYYLNLTTSGLNLTITDFSAQFTFNGTIYDATIITNSNYITAIVNVTMPDLISGSVTLIGEWNLSLNNINSFYNSTISVNALSPAVIVNGSVCTTGLDQAMFFKTENEETFTPLPANISYNFQVGVTTNEFATIYGNISNTYSFSVCINATQTPNWYVGYGEIDYDSSGYADRRYYIFNTTRITTDVTNITLYLLSDSVETAFQLEILRRSSLTPYVSKYAALLRWYPELNSYYVVDMGLTDNNGNTVIHVRTEDVDYRIGVYELNGDLIELADPIRMVCLSAPCTYSLKIAGQDQDYTSFLGIQQTLNYNKTTGLWRATYSDPMQDTSNYNLTIYKQTGASTLTICSSSATGYAGALTCNTSAYTGDLRAILTVDGIPLSTNIVTINTSEFKSTAGLFFLWLIMALIGLGIGVLSPVAAIIGGIIALIPAIYFGSLGIAVLGGFICLGGIMLYFITRNRGY